MTQFRGAQENYNEMIKNSIVEFERIIAEDFPLTRGIGYTVKTYPTMPTVEQAENAKVLIEKLRDNASKQRDEVQKIRRDEVEAKIKELGAIIGMYDTSVKKQRDAKWVIEARSQSQVNLSTSTFWRDTHTAINVINSWIAERKKYETEKKISDTTSAHAKWCKDYIVKNAGIEQVVLNVMSSQSIIELTHSIMKTEYAKRNFITGEKCYCSDHDENRHYHFAEANWNGSEVIVYESSETY